MCVSRGGGLGDANKGRSEKQMSELIQIICRDAKHYSQPPHTFRATSVQRGAVFSRRRSTSRVAAGRRFPGLRMG